jgi:hypothetical protein
MIFTCDACGVQIEHTGTSHVPAGWAVRTIQGRPLMLCDAHAPYASEYGDAEPHLQDLLRARLDMKFGGEEKK